MTKYHGEMVPVEHHRMAKHTGPLLLHVRLAGGEKTSLRLEREFLTALQAIASIEQKSLDEVIQDIEAIRVNSGMANRASAVRVWIVSYLTATLTQI